MAENEQTTAMGAGVVIMGAIIRAIEAEARMPAAQPKPEEPPVELILGLQQIDTAKSLGSFAEYAGSDAED